MKKLIIVMVVATGFVGCQHKTAIKNETPINGRYQLSDDSTQMLDTQTGKLYKKWLRNSKYGEYYSWKQECGFPGWYR
jgi:hypothetical protein